MHLTLTPVLRGCEAWVVREGYEGLVRGNSSDRRASIAERSSSPKSEPGTPAEPVFVHNLRYGDGELLRDGTGDHAGGRTLRGRYIVRVGWDDVRGWFSQVCFPMTFCAHVHHQTEVSWSGRYAHRNSALGDVPHPRRSPDGGL